MPTRQQLNTTPLRTISDFKSRLSGGGARPNLFEVELAFPDAVAIANDVLQKSRFLVKAAALPASTIAPILYLEIVSAAILGYFVFNDIPDFYSIIGVIIIILAGLYVFIREHSHNTVSHKILRE